MAICPACAKELPGEFPFCPFCGAPLSAPVAAAQAKERKVVSVLFCDLVGFTAASESADPEEVAARVAPYHARTRERIEAFGGTVEKFIGDAVAVFGALLAAGNTSAAHALLDETAVGAFHHDPQYAPMLPALARAAHTLDDHDLVARLASDVPDTLPIQQHALATVQAIQAEHAGDHAQAASLYANAAQRWEQFTGVLEQAHALLGRGRCLATLADPEADQPLRRARALFDQMGARPRTNECDTLIARASRLSS